MTTWLDRVEEIFHAALEKKTSELDSFLNEACAGDAMLRQQVQELLVAHQQAGRFMEQPIVDVAQSIDPDDIDDSLIGRVVGHYKITRRIGGGGMGAVYLAERADEHFQKRVAIKVIKRGMDTDSVLRHFRNERQILANFDHPNIARLLDGGATEDGLPYFVMEYVEGVAIDKYCSAHRLKLPERLKLFCKVCSALIYAHRHGIVHRDIKPSNILIDSDGEPKLLDFGIAKALQQSDGADPTVTITTAGVMTPEYASPEQLRAERITPASDVYSLGIVLYQLLTGKQPYRLKTRTREEISRAITEQEPSKPSTAIRDLKIDPSQTGDSRESLRLTGYDSRALRGDLDNIVLMTLRKEPQRRYQSVDQLTDDIGRYLEGRPILARPASPPARWLRWSRRNPIVAGAITICVLLGLIVAWLLREQVKPPTAPEREKSIAVLPFENLSSDPENAFFTNGVQDEILTALSRIADLKVISRTSVADYKSGIERDLREIGQQLGVAHVLEGSVQRFGNRVRVNAQLVDSRTDAHLWAQSYDRDLADVFAIQSDIAKGIANELRAKLTASEQTAIAQPLTTDLTAFLLYNRAKSLLVSTTMSTGLDRKFAQATDLLNEAVARDPSFFLAYCELAYIHDRAYFLNIDHTLARLALAETAIDQAFRLRPHAGEAHLALSEHLYRSDRNYDGALVELEKARQTLPNDPRIFELAGFIQARQGKFQESLRNRERAVELDPRNLSAGHKVAIVEGFLRHYAAQAAVLDRCLAIDPNDIDSKVARARLYLEWKADPRPLHEFIDSTRTENPGALPSVADSWFACALAERDANAAESALAALGESTFGNDAMLLDRTFGEGLLARMANDEAKAHAAFTAARAEQEKRVGAQPNYGPAVCVLGLIDAGLGRKEDALREGRRAVQLLPVAKDAIDGAHMVEYLAIIATWVGEKDLACEQLDIVTRLPGYVSYGELKLQPYWDPLRGDPRFEKIVTSLAPK